MLCIYVYLINVEFECNNNNKIEEELKLSFIPVVFMNNMTVTRLLRYEWMISFQLFTIHHVMNNTMMMLYLFIMLNEFLGARIKRMRVTLTPALQPVIAMLEHNAPSIVELA